MDDGIKEAASDHETQAWDIQVCGQGNKCSTAPASLTEH